MKVNVASKSTMKEFVKRIWLKLLLSSVISLLSLSCLLRIEFNGIILDLNTLVS